LCGIPAAARATTSKDGRTMGFVTLSDEAGLFEVTLFPRIYAEHRALLGGGDVGLLWVAGKVESEYDAITITADRIGRMEPNGG
jgi:DNA polymerase III alpha subunit